MTNIDCTGQVCPIPVIRTKKSLAAMGEAGGVVTVLVDNDISRQNLQKMATGLGYQSEYQQRDNGIIEVTIVAGEGCAVEQQTIAIESDEDSGLVVAIGRDTMGAGDPELGKILIKGFIYAVKELTPLPTHVLFFNSGVSLATSESNSIEDLRELEAASVVVLICGTCTNYYGITEKIGVGEITNMYGIVTAMASAKRIINI
ncbi:MAG TPA: sulfurtransferase-like selenium metabolism protein YedF [Desulfosporosinus sp.]|nr:sulfurtransferase-like selenium metabolism protein YedF [Desulfosporosinus sp.]